MNTYEIDLNDLKEQILKEGDTLVSKRALLERFCKMDEEYNGEPWNLLQILSNIDVLVGKEPSTQKWIPVSERLPQKKEQVLCCEKDKVFIGCMVFEYDGVTVFSESNYKHFYVTAWMPMPKSYKKQKLN